MWIDSQTILKLTNRSNQLCKDIHELKEYRFIHKKMRNILRKTLRRCKSLHSIFWCTTEICQMMFSLKIWWKVNFWFFESLGRPVGKKTLWAYFYNIINLAKEFCKIEKTHPLFCFYSTTGFQRQTIKWFHLKTTVKLLT